MTYHQTTFEERSPWGLRRQRGPPPAAIARVLDHHRSTIGREVRRNRARSDGSYRPQLADWYARGRRAQSRNQRFTAVEWARIHALLREDWSPEQVAGWLRRQGELAISHETIYRYIWADKRLAHPAGATAHPSPAASRADQHGRQRDRVSRVRGARAGHGHPILLRDTTPCLGTRDEREHQRLAPPIPPETPEHGPPHPARLYADRRKTEPPAAEATRLSHSGGMLCPLGLSVALQS